MRRSLGDAHSRDGVRMRGGTVRDPPGLIGQSPAGWPIPYRCALPFRTLTEVVGRLSSWQEPWQLLRHTGPPKAAGGAGGAPSDRRTPRQLLGRRRNAPSAGHSSVVSMGLRSCKRIIQAS